MPDGLDKQTLRSMARARRRNAPCADDGPSLARAALSSAPLAAASCLAAFASLPGESNTAPLLDACWRRGTDVLLPWFDRGSPHKVAWGRYRGPGTLTPAAPRETALPGGERLDARALAAADVVLVPALAVDRAGTRLGQGGGWYDRALRHRRPDAVLLAVLHPEEVCREALLPREPHDVAMHGWLTIDGVHLLTDDVVE